MLNIYKASAGSGKTHRLTWEYIRLLFLAALGDGYRPASDSPHRQILAVTFTNKATDEMKQRILSELDGICGGKSGPETDRLREAAGLDGVRLRELAGTLLVRILNDYSAFNISTIDRFFQRILRAFARELGQSCNYNVELDQDAVLAESVDALMDSLEDRPDLLEWMIGLALENIENGQSWDATKKLTDMGRRLFTEEYKAAASELEARLNDKVSMKRFRDRLQTLLDGYADLDDKAVRELDESERRDLESARILLPDIYTVALFADIRDRIRDYCRENEVVLLSETADFLNRIIGDADAPFLYEKIGTRIRHYMLDEFQDTSALQWRNFEPLLRESLAAGNENLLVGDVKQCIYRWRNSDWSLLNGEVERRFAGQCRVETLETNWRSGGGIVRFNNDFFCEAARTVQRRYDGDSDTDGGVIKAIFRDVRQRTPPGRERQGRVSLQFVDRSRLSDKDWKAAVLERLPGIIRELTGRGYRLDDITLLVRRNTEGSQVSHALMEAGFQVVTEESLSLSSSQAVLAVVGRLEEVFEQGTFLPGESLYALCERLVRELEPAALQEQVFLRTFLDGVSEYGLRQGPDLKGLLAWWNESGKDRSVAVPDGENALHVMTIHKAKGLAARVVILPFFEEPFAARGGFHRQYIWARTDREPFRELPLVPLLYGKPLRDSWFAEHYWRENLYSLVDGLNVSYVAFTRARDEMIVCAARPKVLKKGNYSVNGLSDELFRQYEKELLAADDGSPWFVYETGERGRLPEQPPLPPAPACFREDGAFRSVPLDGRLQLTLKGEAFFDRSSQRSRGVVLHEILSRVERKEDLAESVREAVRAGDLSAAEAEAAAEWLAGRLDSVADRHWFDGTWTYRNECTLLDRDGSLLRPDRILFREGEAQVIDYKFGSERRPEHRKQVAGYTERVRAMGYRTEGYLWYVELGCIEAVS